MKICKRCGEEKELATRSSMCRECHRTYTREHYQNNKKYYKDKAKRWSNTHRRIVREYIIKYLAEHPCVDCGEADPIVLQFDHQRDKLFNIADTCRNTFISMQSLEEEIKKCEIRCANCHCRKTAKDFNWWKHTSVYPNATNVLEG